MLKVTLFLLAAALAGCASTREESAAATQGELPRHCLLGLGSFATSEGADGCDRLMLGRSLDDVRGRSIEHVPATSTTRGSLDTTTCEGLRETKPALARCPGQGHVWR